MVGKEEVTSCACHNGKTCRYLGGGSVFQILAERDYLRRRVDELAAACELGTQVLKMREQEIASLQEENRILKAERTQERQERYAPAKKEKKSGLPGAPVGHRGVTREKPREPDRTVSVHLKCCPHCQGKVTRLAGPNSFSEHIQEDIRIIRETALFRHYHYWCSTCKKVVQGIGEGEIPRSYLGPNAVVLSTLLHYDIGIPLGKIAKLSTDIFQLPLTTGTLIGMDKRVAKRGIPLYNALEEKIRNSSVSYLDETGWPVNRDLHWLWHAGNKEGSLYKVDKGRNHQVAESILGKDYQGAIVSDCLGTYNLVNAGAKQKCLAHILRDLKALTALYPNRSEVITFSVALDNILHEGLDIKEEYARGTCALDDLQRGKEDMEKKEVDATNNFSERQLRSSVILRKLSFGNKTKEGADRHAVMMSLIQTAKLQKKDLRDFLRPLVVGLPQVRAPT